MTDLDPEKELESHIRVEAKIFEQLKASESRTRQLLEAMPNIVVLYDGDGCISYANQAWKRLLGNELNDVIGKRLVDFCHPEDRDLIDPVEEIKTSIEVRFSKVLAGHCCMKMQAEKRPDGQYQGFLIDVSEIRILEQVLRKSQNLDSIGRVSGWIAHEFNNLLTVILGGSDRILSDQTRDLPAARLEANRIQKAANQAAELTKQLMTVSSQQVMRNTVVDVAAKMQEFYSALEELVASKAIKLHPRGFDIPGLVVKVDPTQLAIAVTNLVLNAREAMEPQGDLWIELNSRTLTNDEDHGQDLPPGDYVVLAVEDDGCGIEESILEQIFEPFFTTKDPVRGTGFGLAIAHGIMKQSKGSIGVQSTVGVGTRFELFFPLTTLELTLDAEAEGSIPEQESYRVLLVDDEPLILELTAGALRGENFVVDTSSSGAEAIEMIKKSDPPYDLVVTDVVMPLDGGKLLLRYLSDHAGDTKVLAVSGYDQSVLHEISPTVNFLQKPFRIPDFIQRVSDLLAVD
ncbi:MAG: ATP-binding protein [Planctomycetota bacterium]|nr:ATP-binding protein [Planctomycetota bacterium]